MKEYLILRLCDTQELMCFIPALIEQARNLVEIEEIKRNICNGCIGQRRPQDYMDIENVEI